MDTTQAKHVLIFDADVMWAKSISEVLTEANLKNKILTENFDLCKDVMAKEGYEVLLVNIHSLENPTKQIGEFCSKWPATEILCVYETADPPFDAITNPVNPKLHRCGRKENLTVDIIQTQIETLLRLGGVGSIDVALDDRIFKISKNMSRSDAGGKRFNLSKIQPTKIIEELTRIIREIFLESSSKDKIATGVRVEPFGSNEGNSGSVLLKITPVILLDSSRTKSAVLKFGPINEIRKESQNYDRFVEWFLTVEQTVRKVAYAEGNFTAGILYSYPREKPVGFLPFAEYARESSASDCLQIIHNIFNTDNKHWLSVDGNSFVNRNDTRFQIYYFNKVISCEMYQLREVYYKKLREEISKYQKANNVNVWNHKNDHINFSKLSLKIPNPIKYLQLPHINCLNFSVVHGDLHGYNVLVDVSNKYYFIDFSHTGFGHCFQDFIELELSLRYDILCSRKINSEIRIAAKDSKSIEFKDLLRLIQLEREIIKKSIYGIDSKAPFLDENDPEYSEELDKVYKLVCSIRAYANLNFPEANMVDYYRGLIATSIKAIKFFIYLEAKLYRLIISGLYIKELTNNKEWEEDWVLL